MRAIRDYRCQPQGQAAQVKGFSGTPHGVHAHAVSGVTGRRRDDDRASPTVHAGVTARLHRTLPRPGPQRVQGLPWRRDHLLGSPGGPCLRLATCVRDLLGHAECDGGPLNKIDRRAAEQDSGLTRVRLGAVPFCRLLPLTRARIFSCTACHLAGRGGLSSGALAAYLRSHRPAVASADALGKGSRKWRLLAGEGYGPSLASSRQRWPGCRDGASPCV